jgi:excinuclease UvrABC ATPase subunit
LAELPKKGEICALDELTIGLHMADIDRLMAVLDRLVDAGNTVLIVSKISICILQTSKPF